jgi:hypothetical protein
MNELIRKYEEIEEEIIHELEQKEKWGYTCSCEEKNVFIYTTIDLIGIPYCVNCGGIVRIEVGDSEKLNHDETGIPEIRKRKHAQEMEDFENSFKKYNCSNCNELITHHGLCASCRKDKKEKEMEEAKARYNRLLGDK